MSLKFIIILHCDSISNFAWFELLLSFSPNVNQHKNHKIFICMHVSCKKAKSNESWRILVLTKNMSIVCKFKIFFKKSFLFFTVILNIFYLFNNIINWDVNEQYGKSKRTLLSFSFSWTFFFLFNNIPRFSQWCGWRRCAISKKKTNFILIFHSMFHHSLLLFAVFHPEALNCELNKLLLSSFEIGVKMKMQKNERKQSQIWWVEIFMKMKRRRSQTTKKCSLYSPLPFLMQFLVNLANHLK